MKSKASLKSHPLHPILVSFPIAFFTGTLAAHVAGWALHNTNLLYTAYLLNAAGVIMAVVAAIPGLIDYVYTVPPKSSGKKRAAQHGLMNTTMLILFAVALFYRRDDDANKILLLALEMAGVVLLVAGWWGGTLVHRNQIGVDHRYANAGKWNEAYFSTTHTTLQGATTDELKISAMKLLHINDKRIVLARTEKGFAAFDDRCPHRGGSLAGGSLACGVVQCPWHGSQFQIKDGSVTAGPAKESIKTYTVSEENGAVLLTL